MIAMWMALHMAMQQPDIAALKACRPIKIASVRLACYDNVIDGQSFTGEAEAQALRNDFGRAEMRAAELDRELPEQKDMAGDVQLSVKGDAVLAVSVTITAIEKNLRGRRRFTTSDGQVWLQKGTERMAPEPLPFAARIKRAIGGSFSLVSEKYPKVIKVRRIK